MFAGISRRKQKRPQHLTELTGGSEEAKFVAMSDRETDRRSTTASTANRKPRENELIINEDDATVADDRIFAAQRIISDGEKEVVSPEGQEEGAGRGPCSPFSFTTTSSISTHRIVDDRREKRSHSGDGADKEAGFVFQRDLSALRGDGINLLRAGADFYDDRRTLPTGSSITAAENYVIGKESHVTKLQSFVESLNDRPERGSRLFESPFVCGSFPPLLLPRLKPVYWTRHNGGCGSLQANSAYCDTSSPSSCSAAAAKTRSSPGVATDGPLDLSTSRRFVSESGVRDSRQFEAQRLKVWGRGENFERSDRSTQALQNLRFLPFVSANQSKKVAHDSTELNSIASFLQIKDCWPNVRPDLIKRRKEEINFHDSTTDVSSYLLKSQSPETNENGNRKRRQRVLSSRCHQSQENSAKRRKPNTTEDLTNVDGIRNSLQMRSHPSSKFSGQLGKRGKDPDVGLGGESLEAIDDETKRDDDTAADLLRTECTCGMTFDSLYRLALHIQKSGHVPENHRSDSSKSVCGQEAWKPGEQRSQEEREMLENKHIQRSTELNGSVIYAGGQLAGTTGSDPNHQRHDADFVGGTLIATDEPEMDSDGRSSAIDRNLRLLFNLHSRLDVANDRRETGEESGFKETDRRNSAICGIRRKLRRKRDEASIKMTSKESPSDGNAMSSINDHLSRDDNEQLKTSEQMIRSVACRTDTFSEEVDETDQPIDRYFSERIHQEQFARSASSSPHSAAAILPQENATEMPPLVRAVSSIVCSVAGGSDSPSAADDHSKPVSRRSSRSSELKGREKPSRDRPTDVSKTPKCGSTNGRQRIVINETSSAVGANEAAVKEEAPASQVAPERVMMTNSDRQTGRRRRKTNEQKSNPRERHSSDLLLCKRRFPGVAPQQVLASGNSVGVTRCSVESPIRAVGFDLPFVWPPSSDHVDGSLSLWAMKKFVDSHFCAQSNAHLTTEGSTLPKNNYKITGDDTSTTCKAESRCSDNSRRLTTTKILRESLTVKNLQVPPRKQNTSNRLFATTEEQKETKENAKDVGEQKIEDPTASGSHTIDHDSASDTDLSSTVLHSPRLQRQSSDECSSIADGPRNGVTAVQSSETTTKMVNSSCPDGAEKGVDATITIPAAFTKKKKSKSSSDEGELTGNSDKKKKTRLPTPQETNLISSSSSSAFPCVDYHDDDDSDGNSAADEAVDRFLCSESQSLEQVC